MLSVGGGAVGKMGRDGWRMGLGGQGDGEVGTHCPWGLEVEKALGVGRRQD